MAGSAAQYDEGMIQSGNSRAKSSDFEPSSRISTRRYSAMYWTCLGYTHQFLPQPIQPFSESMRVVGRAMPVQIADAWGKQEDPFGLMTEALDQILPGEVYVATGGSHNCAAWGEILTATARTRGGLGAVIDGYHRDTPAGPGAELAGFQPRHGMRKTQVSARRLWTTDARRNRRSSHRPRRPDFWRHGRGIGCALVRLKRKPWRGRSKRRAERR